MPIITAKRSSPCVTCSMRILVGERIHFTHSTGAQHITCVEEFGSDPEIDVRVAYETWRNTGHLDDQQAFDECVNEFGYVDTVRALYNVSAVAKQKEDAYRARRRPRA